MAYSSAEKNNKKIFEKCNFWQFFLFFFISHTKELRVNELLQKLDLKSSGQWTQEPKSTDSAIGLNDHTDMADDHSRTRSFHRKMADFMRTQFSRT